MFKNRSLQNHVDRLKASFSEEVSVVLIKIANLQGQVDQMNSKYSTTTRFIEDDFNYKFEKAIKEKDDEIKKMLSKMNDLIEYNDKLSIKVDENMKVIEDLRRGYSEKMNEIQMQLNKKDLEIIEMRNFYEAKIDALTKNYDEEKSRIITNYDENFNK